MRKLSFIILLAFAARETFGAGPNDKVIIRLRPNESGHIADLSNQQKTNLKGNVETEIQMQYPMVVRLDGRIPMVLIPVLPGSTEIKINPPTYREAAGETSQKEISQIVSEVMIAIESIQKEIQKKNYDQAMFILEETQKKYQDVAFLNFVRGSILFLQGKKNKARKAVTKALQSHPNYKEGKEFLKALGGELAEGAPDE